MKLNDLLKVATPFLATDKSPEALRAAIIAADKKAKDGKGSGLGARELEEEDQPKAQDADALDAREAALDEREEKADAEDKSEAALDRKAARDARKAARDARAMDRKAARDRDDDPEGTNDEDLSTAGDPETPGGNRAKGKTAIDSAEVDRRVAAAVAARDARHEALREVEPILGVVNYDSAPKAYRAALEKLGVDGVDKIHDSALRPMLVAIKARAAADPAPAMDSAEATNFHKAINGYDRLR